MYALSPVCIDSFEVKSLEQRRWLPALASAAGMLALILDSRTALSSATEGVALCIKTIIPSLFPFIFLSGTFSGSCSGYAPGFLGRLPGIPRGMESLLIPALLGGYPIGAQCTYEAYRSHGISKRQAERMLAYCSNVGPAFIFGILPASFGGVKPAWAIWAIQLFSIWTAALVFAPPWEEAPPPQKPQVSFGMEQAVGAMLKICGWVILFRVLIGFLACWFLWGVSPVLQTLLSGFLELTNGCCRLDKIIDGRIRFCVCNVLLAFGGICILYQTHSVCPGLRLRFYCQGKLLQAATAGIVAAALCYGIWWLIPAWATGLFGVKAIEKRVEIPGRVVYNRGRNRWRADDAVSQKN